MRSIKLTGWVEKSSVPGRWRVVFRSGRGDEWSKDGFASAEDARDAMQEHVNNLQTQMGDKQ